MADEHESSRRARPAMPALPPFRGPAGAPARPPLPPVPSPDHRKAPPPFIGARPTNGSRPAPNGHGDRPPLSSAPQLDAPVLSRVVSKPSALPDAVGQGIGRAIPQRESLEQRPNSAATREEAADSGSADLPWLDTSGAGTPVLQSPTSSDAIPFPPFDATPSEVAAPEEAAQALAGLPYFDGDGDKHEEGSPPSLRASGRMHRIEADPASVLERVAARVRNGELLVPDVDPLDGDAATMAAVLAALLKRRS